MKDGGARRRVISATWALAAIAASQPPTRASASPSSPVRVRWSPPTLECGVRLQVGIARSESAAMRLAEGVAMRYPQLTGLRLVSRSAPVRGRLVHRAVFEGFAGAREAEAICESLQVGGQPCLVWLSTVPVPQEPTLD